ncbi:hypothetical protein [Paenibacillus sp. S150]|uniref:hypothetical protein n=1 Tax=Paenibacillus sp. S150 TaxID=2749826 RepID=UPI001C55F74A|nr:hypothetical protein [Paenibacillus sp. S150]MBW4082362.1 hypothetical protein [Paenibacillus sp. S150]
MAANPELLCCPLCSILAPSNYAGFQRLPAPGGSVAKIIPGPGYLQELRGLLYGRSSKPAHSNSSELRERFSESFEITKTRRFQYKVRLKPPLLQQLVRMTPLSWAAEAKLRSVLQLQRNALEIPAALSVLAGRKPLYRPNDKEGARPGTLFLLSGYINFTYTCS